MNGAAFFRAEQHFRRKPVRAMLFDRNKCDLAPNTLAVIVWSTIFSIGYIVVWIRLHPGNCLQSQFRGITSTKMTWCTEICWVLLRYFYFSSSLLHSTCSAQPTLFLQQPRFVLHSVKTYTVHPFYNVGCLWFLINFALPRQWEVYRNSCFLLSHRRCLRFNN